MNCSTCRYELSQCLDGRLASGRRAAVLQHAESCAECGTFWAELQAAQRLTLSLPEIPVGNGFREGLWERIRAGEGTPDAVFHEPVPTLTKLRYALSGAAAAAVLLLGAIFWRGLPLAGPEDYARPTDTDAVARVGGQSTTIDAPAGTEPVQPASTGLQPRRREASLASYDGSLPMLTPKPLTLNVVAMETARQLEDSYADARIGLRMLRDPRHDRAAATLRVLRSAREMHDFGELLLDLRNRERVHFKDSRTDADLLFAVQMLAQAAELGSAAGAEQQPMVVERFVAPALDKERLASLSDSILVEPTRDEMQEIEVLMRLNTTRPEVFPKLFVVLGDQSAFAEELSLVFPNFAFSVQGACGPSWVAPRSEVHRNSLRIRLSRR